MNPTFYTLNCGGYQLAMPASQVLSLWENEAIRYVEQLPVVGQDDKLYPVYSLGEELRPRLGPALGDTHCLLIANFSGQGGAIALSGKDVSKISEGIVLHKLPDFILPTTSPLKAMLKYQSRWLYLTDAASLLHALETAHVQRDFRYDPDSLAG